LVPSYPSGCYHEEQHSYAYRVPGRETSPHHHRLTPASPPRHSGQTKLAKRCLRRKSPPAKSSVGHEQGGREHLGIGLDVEPSSGTTRLHIVAGQLHHPTRLQTQPRAAYGIRREHEHLIGMELLRIDIRQDEP